jgi:GT2 family glycosyltransferase
MLTPVARRSRSKPVCSVVIPNYNGRKLLETCLESVDRNRPRNIPIEVIVVDDASTDDSIAWLAIHHPDVRVVALDRNQGFCAAANAGIAAAKAPYIQLLNNDTEVCENWIEAGLEPFVDPRIGSVAPLVLVRSDPSRVDSAGDSYAWYGKPDKRGRGEPADRFARQGPRLVFGASASSAFYRASALAKIGGFDLSFGSYYEDVEIAFRLRWAGYRCMFNPRCVIHHEISASYDHARPELQRRMARNAEILFWTRLPLAWLAASVVPHLAFTLAQATHRALTGRFRAFALGKIDAIQKIKDIRFKRSLNRSLALSAIARPHFPIQILPFADPIDRLPRNPEPASPLRKSK